MSGLADDLLFEISRTLLGTKLKAVSDWSSAVQRLDHAVIRKPALSARRPLDDQRLADALASAEARFLPSEAS